MRTRSEDDPEEPDEPDEEVGPATSAAFIPSVTTGGREFEYRTQSLTPAQVADGKTLAALLGKASADGWDLVDVLATGDRHVVLLRKPRKDEKEARRVGFAIPRD